MVLFPFLFWFEKVKEIKTKVKGRSKTSYNYTCYMLSIAIFKLAWERKSHFSWTQNAGHSSENRRIEEDSASEASHWGENHTGWEDELRKSHKVPEWQTYRAKKKERGLPCSFLCLKMNLKSFSGEVICYTVRS